MSDILFDLQNNDVGISDGDFATVVDPSVQNATLMLLKNPVNILQPQFGVGFEMFALNARPEYVSSLAATAKRQVLKDGADYCNITITEGEKYGEYSVAVDAQYPIDEIPSGTVTVDPRTSRTYEIRIVAVPKGGESDQFIDGVTVRINITMADGKQSDWMLPTSIEKAPGGESGTHDVYIWQGDGASLKPVTINVEATKDGYNDYTGTESATGSYDNIYLAFFIELQAST